VLFWYQHRLTTNVSFADNNRHHLSLAGKLTIQHFLQSPMRTLAQPNRISKVCSGQQHNPLIIRSGNGSIVHPLPPQKKYAKNELCQWNFILPQSQLLILTFKGKFDIEPGRRDGLCRDYLQILPGTVRCYVQSQMSREVRESRELTSWAKSETNFTKLTKRFYSKPWS